MPSVMNLGCCVDKECRTSTCMKLPEGNSCGECTSFKRCTAMFGAKSTDIVCDFFPRRFRLAVVEASQ